MSDLDLRSAQLCAVLDIGVWTKKKNEEEKNYKYVGGIMLQTAHNCALRKLRGVQCEGVA